MFEKKQDKRSLRSRKWMKNSLMDLYEEKGYDAISVTDICNRADISRYTYYNHYSNKDELLVDLLTDIALDVIKATEIDVVDRIIFDEEYEIKNVANGISPFKISKKHSGLMKIGLTRFHVVLLDELRSFLIDHYNRSDKITEFRIKNEVAFQQYISFISGGFLALLENWLKDDLKTTESEMDRAFSSYLSTLSKSIFRL